MIKYYDDIDAARAAHEADGGWLLDAGDGAYQVTDDPGIVHDSREHGEDYLHACEVLEHWDETTPCDIPEHIATLMDDDIREKLHLELDDDGFAFFVEYLRAHRNRFGEEFIVN